MSQTSNEDPTKQNYEVADKWHAQKSSGYEWGTQRTLFASRLPSGARLLDAGAGGSGRDIVDFTARGFIVDGLDYSAPAIASLRKKFPNLRFFEADIRATELPDASYQGIWACASLLNIPKSEVPETLAEFHRLLQDGGLLFISVKQGGGERMVPDQAGERLFSFFSEEELRDLVQKAGFEVQKLEVVEDNSLTGKNVQPPPSAWICLHARKA